MLNAYLKLSLTSFKNKFQQKQPALYKSYAIAQSGNPELSHACLTREVIIKRNISNFIPSYL